jgi:hypothetical protein
MNNSLNLKSLVTTLKNFSRQISRYRVVITLVLVFGIYGFVFWRIQTLSGAEPSINQINAQTNPAIGAHIDKHVVDQLRQLRDNSVNVQALFNQDRNNPFQE